MPLSLIDQEGATILVAMARQALDDADLIEGAGLTAGEAQYLLGLDAKEVN